MYLVRGFFVASALFALAAFGMLAFASPVASTEVAKRTGTDLQAILDLCLDLRCFYFLRLCCLRLGFFCFSFFRFGQGVFEEWPMA